MLSGSCLWCLYFVLWICCDCHCLAQWSFFSSPMFQKYVVVLNPRTYPRTCISLMIQKQKNDWVDLSRTPRKASWCLFCVDRNVHLGESIIRGVFWGNSIWLISQPIETRLKNFATGEGSLVHSSCAYSSKSCMLTFILDRPNWAKPHYLGHDWSKYSIILYLEGSQTLSLCSSV